MILKIQWSSKMKFLEQTIRHGAKLSRTVVLLAISLMSHEAYSLHSIEIQNTDIADEEARTFYQGLGGPNEHTGYYRWRSDRDFFMSDEYTIKINEQNKEASEEYKSRFLRWVEVTRINSLFKDTWPPLAYLQARNDLQVLREHYERQSTQWFLRVLKTRIDCLLDL